ncbi:MAG: hypothetical protein ACJAX9_001455 [Celeribacter sp.]
MRIRALNLGLTEMLLGYQGKVGKRGVKFVQAPEDVTANITDISEYNDLTTQKVWSKVDFAAYAVPETSEIPIWICYRILPVSFGLLLLTHLLFPQSGSETDVGVKI